MNAVSGWMLRGEFAGLRTPGFHHPRLSVRRLFRYYSPSSHFISIRNTLTCAYNAVKVSLTDFNADTKSGYPIVCCMRANMGDFYIGLAIGDPLGQAVL